MADRPSRSVRLRTLVPRLAVVLICGLVGAHWQSTRGATPDAHLKHIIFVLLENHSFDNIFGRLPGADGATTATVDGQGRIPLLHAPRACPALPSPQQFERYLPAALTQTLEYRLGLSFAAIEHRHQMQTLAQIAGAAGTSAGACRGAADDCCRCRVEHHAARIAHTGAERRVARHRPAARGRGHARCPQHITHAAVRG